MSPAIDVSFVLDDPMFQDSFTVTRTPTLGDGTPDTANVQTLTVKGVVLAGSMERTLQPDDSAHVERTITLHTRTQLYDVSANYQPDVVLWHGGSYKVMRPWDYSSYGSGFYAFECERTDLVSSA